MKLDIKNFLVVDTAKKNELRNRNRSNEEGEYSFTLSGVVCFPIGHLVPFILKGDSCKGYAKIKSLYITENSTTVTFDHVPLENEAICRELYNQYRMEVTNNHNNSEGDLYETDMIVPGAYVSSRMTQHEAPKKRKLSKEKRELYDIYGY